MTPAPPALLARAVGLIDGFADLVGLVVAWLMLPLVGAVAWEVISRYVFDKPTIWSYDVTYMLYATMFMLGAAYTLRVGAHIRTDFFWEKWSVRTKGLIDTVAYIVFFFPGIGLFLWVTAGEAWYAFDIGERSEQTPWRPILWPLKAVIPATALLLLVQGASELAKSIYAWRTGHPLEPVDRAAP